jgi:hypothetical protein
MKAQLWIIAAELGILIGWHIAPWVFLAMGVIEVIIEIITTKGKQRE